MLSKNLEHALTATEQLLSSERRGLESPELDFMVKSKTTVCIQPMMRRWFSAFCAANANWWFARHHHSKKESALLELCHCLAELQTITTSELNSCSPGRSVVIEQLGLLVHVWEDAFACQSFVRAWKQTLVQASPGVFIIPQVTFRLFQEEDCGRYVTSMLLLPRLSPLTPFEMSKKYVNVLPPPIQSDSVAFQFVQTNEGIFVFPKFVPGSKPRSLRSFTTNNTNDDVSSHNNKEKVFLRLLKRCTASTSHGVVELLEEVIRVVNASQNTVVLVRSKLLKWYRTCAPKLLSSGQQNNDDADESCSLDWDIILNGLQKQLVWLTSAKTLDQHKMGLFRRFQCALHFESETAPASSPTFLTLPTLPVTEYELLLLFTVRVTNSNSRGDDEGNAFNDAMVIAHMLMRDESDSISHQLLSGFVIRAVLGRFPSLLLPDCHVLRDRAIKSCEKFIVATAGTDSVLFHDLQLFKFVADNINTFHPDIGRPGSAVSAISLVSNKHEIIELSKQMPPYGSAIARGLVVERVLRFLSFSSSASTSSSMWSAQDFLELERFAAVEHELFDNGEDHHKRGAAQYVIDVFKGDLSTRNVLPYARACVSRTIVHMKHIEMARKTIVNVCFDGFMARTEMKRLLCQRNAILQLQRMCRGQDARRFVSHLRVSKFITQIQSVSRGFVVRCQLHQALKEYKSCCLLQRCGRGLIKTGRIELYHRRVKAYIIVSFVKGQFSKEWVAAKRLDRLSRGPMQIVQMFCQTQLSISAAHVKANIVCMMLLQRVGRGFSSGTNGRRAVAMLRAEEKALIIQRTCRGFSDGRRQCYQLKLIKELEAHVLEVQRLGRGYLFGRVEVVELKKEQIRRAKCIQIQSTGRGFLKRCEVSDRKREFEIGRLVRCIQFVGRGYLCRSRGSESVANEYLRRRLEPLKNCLSGYVTRRSVGTTTRCDFYKHLYIVQRSVKAALSQVYREQLKESRMIVSNVLVQSALRWKRSHFQRLLHLEENKLQIVQRFGRGLMTRTSVKMEVKARRIGAKYWNGFLSRFRLFTLWRLKRAQLLQRISRGYMIRKELQINRVKHAIATLPRCIVGFRIRKQLGQNMFKKSLLKIQSLIRGHEARALVAYRRNRIVRPCVSIVQRLLRAKVCSMRVTLQRSRKHRQHAVYLRFNSCVAVQAILRAMKSIKVADRRLRRIAVMRLQRAGRGFLFRRLFQEAVIEFNKTSSKRKSKSTRSFSSVSHKATIGATSKFGNFPVCMHMSLPDSTPNGLDPRCTARTANGAGKGLAPTKEELRARLRLMRQQRDASNLSTACREIGKGLDAFLTKPIVGLSKHRREHTSLMPPKPSDPDIETQQGRQQQTRGVRLPALVEASVDVRRRERDATGTFRNDETFGRHLEGTIDDGDIMRSEILNNKVVRRRLMAADSNDTRHFHEEEIKYEAKTKLDTSIPRIPRFAQPDAALSLQNRRPLSSLATMTSSPTSVGGGSYGNPPNYWDRYILYQQTFQNMKK